MATTTLNAIRDSLISTIEGLDPSGKAWKRGKYREGGRGFSWEVRERANYDRRFTVEDLKGGEPTFYGVTAETDYNGSVIIRIGHKITDDRKASIERRDTDLQQIRQNLEKMSNFPTGVSVVRLSSQETVEFREISYWLTNQVFNLHFTLASI